MPSVYCVVCQSMQPFCGTKCATCEENLLKGDAHWESFIDEGESLYAGVRQVGSGAVVIRNISVSEAVRVVKLHNYWVDRSKGIKIGAVPGLGGY